MREALAWIEFREFIAGGEQFPHAEILYEYAGHNRFEVNLQIPSLPSTSAQVNSQPPLLAL